MSQTYYGAESYRFVGSTQTQTRNKKNTSVAETGFDVAFSKPASYRVEFTYKDAGTWLRVSDGKTTSSFRTINKQRDSRPVAPNDLATVESTIVGGLAYVAGEAKGPRLAGTETVEAAGKSYDCHIVELPNPERVLPDGMQAVPTRLWIAKDSHLVVKHVAGSKSKDGNTENQRITTFSKISFNEPLAADLFTLPAGK
jgi:outer membrane lipoprotein-sorting protein